MKTGAADEYLSQCPTKLNSMPLAFRVLVCSTHGHHSTFNILYFKPMDLRVTQHPFNHLTHTCGDAFSKEQNLLYQECPELAVASCGISTDNITWRADCQELPLGSETTMTFWWLTELSVFPTDD